MGAMMNRKDTSNAERMVYLNILKRVFSIIKDLGLFVAIAILVIFFAAKEPRFISIGNILNIASQMVTLGILAFGVTFVMVAGGVDLSVGSNVSLVSVVIGLIISSTGSITLALLGGLLTGLAFGTVNGYLVAYHGAPSFAATIGMMSVGSGLALVLCHGNPVRNFPDSFAFIGNGTLLGIPFQVYIFVVVIIVVYYLLRCTNFGIYCYATGGNRNAAILSGVNVSLIQMNTYILSGMLAAIASIIATSRVMSGQPTMGINLPMQSVAAAIIGGASMSGGRGSITGTLIGVLFIAILYNGCNLIGINPYVQDVIIGGIIIVSAGIDLYRRNRMG